MKRYKYSVVERYTEWKTDGHHHAIYDATRAIYRSDLWILCWIIVRARALYSLLWRCSHFGFARFFGPSNFVLCNGHFENCEYVNDHYHDDNA